MKYVKSGLFIFICIVSLTACSNEDDDTVVSAPFVGDVLLESQAEVDAFTANQYSGIQGNLMIASPGINNLSNIVDVTGMSSLEFIDGTLHIFNNSLTTLNGFNNLKTIGGSLFLNSNDNLQEVDALSNLTSLGETLSISDSGSLQNIDGLSGLTTIPNRLSIGVNIGPGASGIPNLENIDGLSNITAIGGELQIAGTNIINVEGLSGITSFPDKVAINFNPLLTSLSGFEQVTTIGGDLQITQNTLLEDLDALTNLISIGGDLELASNDQLNSINGLSNLTETGGFITMNNNPNLLQLGSGFDNLQQTVGLFLGGSSFVSLSGFPNLVDCDFVAIGGSDALQSIDGFNSLQNCLSLSIGSVNNLQSISGFAALTTLENFNLEQPTTISDGAFSVSAFQNLSTVTIDVGVIGLANSDIDFLSNLVSVGNDLNILNNENLSDLCGLTNLITNNGLVGDYNVFQNLYNPSPNDILNGDCSL